MKNDQPPESALRIHPEEIFRIWPPYSDVPAEYAVDLDSSVPGCCTVYSRRLREDKWEANPWSMRPLISTLVGLLIAREKEFNEAIEELTSAQEQIDELTATRESVDQYGKPTWHSVRQACDNPVHIRLRQIYCCKGSEFNRTDLEAGWIEIANLCFERDQLRERIRELEGELDRVRGEA